MRKPATFRPTARRLDQLAEWAFLGMTIGEVAILWNVEPRWLRAWIRRSPEARAAWSTGIEAKTRWSIAAVLPAARSGDAEARRLLETHGVEWRHSPRQRGAQKQIALRRYLTTQRGKKRTSGDPEVSKNVMRSIRVAARLGLGERSAAAMIGIGLREFRKTIAGSDEARAAWRCGCVPGARRG